MAPGKGSGPVFHGWVPLVDAIAWRQTLLTAMVGFTLLSCLGIRPLHWQGSPSEETIPRQPYRRMRLRSPVSGKQAVPGRLGMLGGVSGLSRPTGRAPGAPPLPRFAIHLQWAVSESGVKNRHRQWCRRSAVMQQRQVKTGAWMSRQPGDQPVEPDVPGKPPEPADTPPHLGC